MKALAAALVVAGAAALVLVVVGLGSRTGASGADIGATGARLISAYGCGGCHTIEGIRGADGQVGPSLSHLSSRRTIAGSLPNTRENVARWVDDPKAVEPQTLMPDLGVTRVQARAIADYLYAH